MAVALVSESCKNSIGDLPTDRITIDLPGSLVNGNLLVAHISRANATFTLATPSGWTLLAHRTTATSYDIYWREVDGEPADYTWIASGSDSFWLGRIVQYSGAAVTTGPLVTDPSTWDEITNGQDPDGDVSPSAASGDHMVVSFWTLWESTGEDALLFLNAPTGYTRASTACSHLPGGIADARHELATKALTGGTSDDPGAWDMAGSNNYFHIGTLLIPAEPPPTPPGSVGRQQLELLLR